MNLTAKGAQTTTMLGGEESGKVEQVIAWLEAAVDADNSALVERLHTLLIRMVGLIPGGGLVDPGFIQDLDLAVIRHEVEAGLVPAASQQELLDHLEAALDDPEPSPAAIWGAFHALILKLAHDHTDRPYARSEDG